ncbi:Hypothetical protein PHPALM_14000, partial [Phytophthora palmivora]
TRQSVGIYRSTGCKDRLDVYVIDGKVLVIEHTCVHVQLENNDTLEAILQMKAMVDTLSVLDLTKPVHKIWKAVSDTYYPHDEITRTVLSGEQRAFWVYFRITWLERLNIEGWNVHSFERDPRFHRGLNTAFSTLPNIFTFVATIRRVSQDYVAKIASVVAGRRKKAGATM